MLHLPDVAQLVRHEVVVAARSVGVAQEDRGVRRVAREAAEPGQTEQPRRVHEPDPVDADGARVPVEPVEAGLRGDQGGMRPGTGSRYPEASRPARPGFDAAGRMPSHTAMSTDRVEITLDERDGQRLLSDGGSTFRHLQARARSYLRIELAVVRELCLRHAVAVTPGEGGQPRIERWLSHGDDVALAERQLRAAIDGVLCAARR